MNAGSLSTVSLVREAGLEFQESGIYGIFETFIHTKCQFYIKCSNISHLIFTLILLRVLVRVKIRVCFAYNKIAFQVKIDASEFTYS